MQREFTGKYDTVEGQEFPGDEGTSWTEVQVKIPESIVPRMIEDMQKWLKDLSL